jgi:YHS domain-containing protein
MIRFLVFLLLAIALYKLLANLIRNTRTGRRNEPADGKIAELVRDPQCGTYLLPEQGLSARVAGHVYYFCSEACRDRFIAEHSARSDKAG